MPTASYELHCGGELIRIFATYAAALEAGQRLVAQGHCTTFRIFTVYP